VENFGVRAARLERDVRHTAPARPGKESAGPSGWTNPLVEWRAACRNRTDDLLITSEMLYRLS
jgi:hypothetical protein